MRNNVIIVAGGKGLRMGSDLPKQFISVGGKPILMHTIEAFYTFDKYINIILVLPISHQGYWKELCADSKFNIPYTMAMGGDTRFHSVKNGLVLVEEGFVAVHDGVRPFVSQDMIKRCFEAAKEHSAVIPVVHPTDSLREIEGEGRSKIIDREKIRLVQTPQVFTSEVIKKAYHVDYDDKFTDDASVVEASGVDIYLVDGERNNIKVTTPLDLKICEFLSKM